MLHLFVPVNLWLWLCSNTDLRYCSKFSSLSFFPINLLLCLEHKQRAIVILKGRLWTLLPTWTRKFLLWFLSWIEHYVQMNRLIALLLLFVVCVLAVLLLCRVAEHVAFDWLCLVYATEFGTLSRVFLVIACLLDNLKLITLALAFDCNCLSILFSSKTLYVDTPHVLSLTCLSCLLGLLTKAWHTRTLRLVIFGISHWARVKVVFAHCPCRGLLGLVQCSEHPFIRRLCYGERRRLIHRHCLAAMLAL